MERRNGSSVLSNLFWKFGERILAQAVTFVVSVLLARMLMPKDYGEIALVLIFINIANVFVSSGLGDAIILRKDINEKDKSSAFWCGLGIACVLYLIIFWGAPWISIAYKNPELTPVFRVLSLMLPLSAVNTIQHAIVAKNMQFKKFFFSTLGGALISGVVGIMMAYYGFGIWALVFQYLVNISIDTLVLLWTVKWYPHFTFSFEKARSMMAYGGRLMISNFINAAYLEIQSIIIGTWYAPADLAQYKRGNQFPGLFVSNINNSISAVIFPVITRNNKNIGKVKQITRHTLRLTAYIILPLMVGLAIVSVPLVKVLLTDKWLDCVPFLRIGCACMALQPLQTANVQAIKAIGRSDVCLKMELVKKVVGCIFLFVAIPYGVEAIAYSLLLAVIFSTFVSCTPNCKLINYGYKEQLTDIIKPLIYCIFMFGCTFPIQFFQMPDLLLLLLQCTIGGGVYVLISWVSNDDSFVYLLSKVRAR